MELKNHSYKATSLINGFSWNPEMKWIQGTGYCAKASRFSGWMETCYASQLSVLKRQSVKCLTKQW